MTSMSYQKKTNPSFIVSRMDEMWAHIALDVRTCSPNAQNRSWSTQMHCTNGTLVTDQASKFSVSSSLLIPQIFSGHLNIRHKNHFNPRNIKPSRNLQPIKITNVITKLKELSRAAVGGLRSLVYSSASYTCVLKLHYSARYFIFWFNYILCLFDNRNHGNQDGTPNVQVLSF